MVSDGAQLKSLLLEEGPQRRDAEGMGATVGEVIAPGSG